MPMECISYLRLSLIALSMLAASSVLAQTKKRPVPRPSVIDRFDSEPFNIGREDLPSGYLGHSLPTIYVSLAARSARMKRGEFEPTIDYNQRIQKLNEIALVGHVRASDLVAFSVRSDVIQLTSHYDADLSVLNISLEWNPFRYAYDRDYTYLTYASTSRFIKSYLGRNAFNRTELVRVFRDDHYLIGGQLAEVRALTKLNDADRSITQKLRASFPISPDAARRLKANLRALVIGTLAAEANREDSKHQTPTITYPYETYTFEHIVKIIPVAIWFYDYETGRVYAKIPSR